ncbi:MAG: alpha/beta hydrolase [Burkholderiaceae bacterium]|nr:alpha/beta hydrolase [Burkholderiaceae bacterium]
MLTPQIKDLLSRIAKAARPPMHVLPVQAARAFYAAGASVLSIDPEPMLVDETLSIPTRDGHNLHAKLWVPHTGARGVLLFFHGGGFTIGSSATHKALCQHMAWAAGCAVVSVDYRLAPEHPFPTAVFDAWDSLHWLQAHAATLAPQHIAHCAIAVGGDSAGGTLAAVSALHARDQGIALALQLLIYPGCGATQDTASHKQFADGFVLSASDIDYFFKQYIPETALREDWRFAPLNARDHAGVAPAWIGLAECDPLFDEGIAYGDVLRSAGVAVDLEVYRGMVHGFVNWERAIPEARHAHADAGAALKAAFA